MMKSFLMLWVLLSAPVALSSLNIDCRQAGQRDLTQEIEVLSHSLPRSLSIEDIKKADGFNWVPLNTYVKDSGMSPKGVWFRMTLNLDAGCSWVMTQPYVLLLKFYQFPNENYEEVEETAVGNIFPFGKREHPYRHLAVSLKGGASKTYYFFIQGYIKRSTFKPALMTRTEFENKVGSENMEWGIYFGVIATFAFFNLLAFFVLKDKTYAYYGAYLIAMAGVFAGLDGFGYRYLWPDATWWNLRVSLVFISFMIFFLALFSQSFLGIRAKSASAYIIYGIAFWSLLNGSGALASVSKLTILSTVSLLMVSFSFFFLLGISYRKDSPGARYYLAATAVLFFFGFISFLDDYIKIPFNEIFYDSFRLGLFIETGILSVALGSRFSEIRKDRDRAREQGKQYEAIARMTQILAHDVKAPFQRLSVAADAIAVNSHSPARMEKYAKRFIEEASWDLSHVTDMIHDVLAIGNTSSLKRDRVDVRDILGDALRSVFGSRPNSDVSFQYEINCPHEAYVSSSQFLRVFINIIKNATEAMKDCGILSFRISEKKSKIYVEIFNSGSYIDQNIREKIFEPFVTIDKKGGVGIGLMICSKVIRDHGGDLRCKSWENVGTSFFFDLPVSKSPVKFEKNLPTHSQEICLIHKKRAQMGAVSVNETDFFSPMSQNPRDISASKYTDASVPSDNFLFTENSISH